MATKSKKSHEITLRSLAAEKELLQEQLRKQISTARLRVDNKEKED